jgi:DNA-binding Lrp family transcriptional regulator
MMPEEHSDNLDEIDRKILRILSEDPRASYAEIAKKLGQDGCEMTAEGIRYRVSQLYESTSLVLMTQPQKHGWENLRLNITTVGGAQTKQRIFEKLSEMPFWIICRGFGSYDLYANATVPSNNKVDQIISDVKDIDGVDDVEFYLETERTTNFDNFLSLQSEEGI